MEHLKPWSEQPVKPLLFLNVSLVAMALATPAQSQDSAAAASNAFAFDSLKVLSKEPGNIAFSPYSAWMALTMTSGGAAGDTLQEMQATLHHAKSDAGAFHEASAQWSAQLKALRDIELGTANRLWVAEGFPIAGSYSTLTTQHYGAGLEQLDFTANPDAARKTINLWIAKQTADRIPELLMPPDVPRDTKLVLTNAIYFKAGWQLPFDPQLTSNLPFTKADATVVQAPMMLRRSSIAHFKNDTFQAIRLPYSGEGTSMLIVLPEKGTAPALTAAAYAELRAGFAPRPVVLRLPRFKVNERLAMVDMLQDMGMRAAFTRSADFSAISAKEKLMIGNVVHQAFVQVGEKGTEAAAATAVVMRPTGARPPSEEKLEPFIVDRPFLFLIVHDITGGILFLGRVDDPAAQ